VNTDYRTNSESVDCLAILFLALLLTATGCWRIKANCCALTLDQLDFILQIFKIFRL